MSTHGTHGTHGNRLRLTADRERCIGAGQCVLSEPRVFDQSEQDGRVVLLTRHPGPEVAEAVALAVRLCPSGALALGTD